MFLASGWIAFGEDEITTTLQLSFARSLLLLMLLLLRGGRR